MTTQPEQTIRRPLMSGFCAAPNEGSHERCQNLGGGQRSNPAKEFQPCPCECHLDEERFDCDNCGGVLALALNLTAVLGEDTYVHVSQKTGRSYGEFCF